MMNISTCRACAVRPCTHDWESHARHLAAELDDLRCDDSCSRTVEELQARARDAEAAIASVRELCFVIDGRESVTVDDVLRALAGGIG